MARTDLGFAFGSIEALFLFVGYKTQTTLPCLSSPNLVTSMSSLSLVVGCVIRNGWLAFQEFGLDFEGV